ncbi:MAG: hypothetical protein JRH11_02000 [Deltaproteobacteria bacterium]|nr:hypothetical protein [Deltaproteobacteria bacterium]
MRWTRMNAGSAMMVLCLAAISPLVLGACDDEPEAPLEAPLEAPEAPELSATLRTFSIDRSTSAVDFLMQAPLENIHGVVPRSMEGELFVDLADLSRSRGLIKVDIDPLELFQRKRESEDEELGEEVKSDTQNEHARTWFQISEDAPAEVREANRYAQFNVTRISDASATNVVEMDGDKRTVTLTAHGDFHLHGHTAQKSAQLELVFSFEGDRVRSMRVRTVSPITVSLAEHEIRPRSAFGTLAQATLSTLGEKIAEAAPITFEVTANAGDPCEDIPAMDVAASAEARAACGLGVDDEPGEGGLPPTGG